MSDKPGELPQGLISFTYNALFNPTINARARADLMQEMSNFGLSDEVRALIYEAQTCGIPDREYEERLVRLLAVELMAKWNDLHRSITERDNQMTTESDQFGPKAGLLSCMYEAIYDPETNASVRGEYEVVLAEYELSPPVQEAALEVSRSNDLQIFGNLLNYLKAEVVDNYEDICNRLRRSPNV